MRRRTQLYLDEDQYRWLKRRAGRTGSISSVVRALIDEAQDRDRELAEDALVSYLLKERPSAGKKGSTVAALDEDVYGAERS